MAPKFSKDEHAILMKSIDDLNEQLKVKENEQNAMLLERNEKAQRVEELKEDLKVEREAFTSETTRWSRVCEEFKLELDAIEQEVTELKGISEADQGKILVDDKTIKDLYCEREKLLAYISQLQNTINGFLLELQEANIQSADRENLLGASEEEKTALFRKILTLKEKLQQEAIMKVVLQSEVDTLREKICILQESQNGIMQDEKATDDLKAENEQLRADASLFRKKISDLDIQLESNNTELTDLNLRLTAYKAKKETMDSEMLIVAARLQQVEVHVKELETELQQSREINLTLEESKSDVEGKLVSKQVQVSDLGKQLKDQENELTAVIQALQEENKELHGRVLAFSEEAFDATNNLRETKEAGIAAMTSLCKAHEKLIVEFEEKCMRIQKWLTELTEDICLFKTHFEATVKDLKRVGNEKSKLQSRDEYHVRTNSGLRDEIQRLNRRLERKAKDEDKMLHEVEGKMKTLQKLIYLLQESKEKVSRVIAEKREAIRQLCMTIEYHRENSNELRQHLSLIRNR